jgi:hypothetical protein
MLVIILISWECARIINYLGAVVVIEFIGEETVLTAPSLHFHQHDQTTSMAR